ncbi:hypothetical protein CK203_058901 [Vitis vinifera]|uniref:DUF4218 domain-containing protein n=1 Tax=Vitis vinifera TaxID=29760 RepID=A0A438FS86_VITVI|nr:hypothetical protein CK203_058901 [Vitis vinifera]
MQKRENNGKLRHPVDSPTWQLVNQMWPEFASDCRNLRLAISADGINPHSSMTSRHSCWPVLTITYNLPLVMHEEEIYDVIFANIRTTQPGKDIDVYLAPLVDDLKALWEVGVKAYDAHQREFFTLKAILLWTINDFPAYGNLSGCTVKGYHACPICGEETNSHWLKHGNKNSLPAIEGFFHATIHLESKRRHLMVNKSLGKTKDGVKSRLDLLEMGLRLGLAPTFGLKRTYLPCMLYSKNLVSMEELKLNGLKSHDYHALMQQLLPVVDVSRLNDLQQDIVVTLCLLEKYFPPSIFDIMLHLTMHLVSDDISKKELIENELKWLAQGPRQQVLTYPGYIINGCRYHIKERDEARVNQNSGVSIVASTMQIASSKDKNPVLGDMCFYGIVRDMGP